MSDENDKGNTEANPDAAKASESKDTKDVKSDVKDPPDKKDAGNDDQDTGLFSKLDDNEKKFLNSLKSKAASLNATKDENKELKAKLAEIEAQKAKEDEEKLKEQGKFKELAEKKDGELKGLHKKLIRQEIRLHAQKEGILDLDVADIISDESVKISDSGEITGAEEVVKNFKTAKGHLFKEAATTNDEGAKSTGSTKKDPNPGNNTATGDRSSKAADLDELRRKDPLEYKRRMNDFVRTGS